MTAPSLEVSSSLDALFLRTLLPLSMGLAHIRILHLETISRETVCQDFGKYTTLTTQPRLGLTVGPLALSIQASLEIGFSEPVCHRSPWAHDVRLPKNFHLAHSAALLAPPTVWSVMMLFKSVSRAGMATISTLTSNNASLNLMKLLDLYYASL